MRHYLVVGSYVELDEKTESGEIVEGVQVEPRVLQRPKEGLDHRVQKGRLDLSQNPCQPFISE